MLNETNDGESVVAAAELSPLQKSMWRFEQLHLGSVVHNIAARCEIIGNIDVGRLARSIQIVIEQNPILRISVKEVKGDLKQVCNPFSSEQIFQQDVSNCTHPDREIDQQIDRFLRERLVLEEGGLFKCLIFRKSEDRLILVVLAHHIAFDGYSLALFFGKLSDRYNENASSSYKAHTEPGFLEFCKTSEDVAAVRRNNAEYWQRQLKQIEGQTEGSPTTFLPTGDIQKISRYEQMLPKYLLQNLRKMARAQKLTLPTVFYSLFSLLMARMSGQDVSSVGFTANGRLSVQSKHVMGPLVSVIPITSAINWSGALDEWLQLVRAKIKEGYQHQEITFAEILDAASSELHIPNCAFNYFTPQNATLRLGDAEIHDCYEITLPNTPFPITLRVVEGSESMTFQFDWQNDCYTAAYIRKLAERYIRLIASSAVAPQGTIGELEFLTADERSRLAPTTLSNTSGNVRDLCLQKAREDPDRPAIDDNGMIFSRRFVDQASNHLAAKLQELGTKQESVVPIVTHRSAAMIISQLAVLKCGAAFLPVDQNLPEKRLLAMIEAVNPSAIIIDETRFAEFSVTHDNVISLTGNANELPVSGKTVTEPISDHTLAYVIFTSGSTGTPKGVAIEHGALANLAAFYSKTFAVKESDRTSVVASPSFDASINEIWPTLSRGGTLVIAPEYLVADTGGFHDWIFDNEINIAFAPTAMGELLIQQDWSGNSSLRVLQLGGEAMTRRPDEVLPFMIANSYGPAEATIISSQSIVKVSGKQSRPDIGFPIDGCEMFITDHVGRPLPDEVKGEIRISGVNLARGYLGRPQLTEERFYQSPDCGGRRLYISGDRGYRRSDGCFQCLGRIDDQLKLRGHRVEAGEIEATLKELPEIDEAAVVLQGNDAFDSHLVAFIAKNSELHESDLKKRLRQTLPQYMIPTKYNYMQSLPLNSSGKINRQKLIEKAKKLRMSTGVSVADKRNPVQRLDLASLKKSGSKRMRDSNFSSKEPMNQVQIVSLIDDLWKKYLELDHIEVDENFFDLGGHSLMATKLMTDLRQNTGLQISLRSFFENPTIGSFTNYIQKNIMERD